MTPLQSSRHIRRRKRPIGEINVVPYIDVMLVLLIIFMVTAPLLKQGVRVDLPRATAATLETEPAREAPFIVTVAPDGALYLNENSKRATAPQEITRQAAIILRRNPTLPFLVRGDRKVAYQHVIRAMVALQAAGVASIGLVTESPDPPATSSP